MRRFLYFIAWTAVLLVAAVLLSPYWLGFALPAIFRPLRATVGSYSRVGYSRFVLENVVVERRTVTIHVARAEADTPWLWAIRHVLRHDHLILADDWDVAVHAGGSSTEPREPEGWVLLQTRLSRIATGLEKWLRRASIGRGHVEWPRNQISLEHALWHERTLQVEKLHWRDDRANLELVFDRVPGQWHLTTQGAAPALDLVANADGVRLQGELKLAGQSAPFTTEFSAEGWLPSKASLLAQEWHFHGDELHLHGYAAVRGTVQAIWENEKFKIVADAQSTPDAGTTFPPLTVSLHAEGDRSHYQIEKADLSIPGISAHLDQPISGDLENAIAITNAPTSRFTVRVDLSKVPGMKAIGLIEGQVEVQPRGKSWPKFHLSGEGKGIAWDDFHLTDLSLAGQLDWPLLTLDHADLSSSSTSKVHVTGGVDFLAKELRDFRAEGHLDAELFKPWLPARVTLAGAQVALVAQGPFNTFTHQGTVRIDELKVHEIQPAVVQLKWHGQGKQLSEYHLGIQTGHTEINAGGSGDADGIKFDQLIWRQGEQDRLTLQSPAYVAWKPDIKIQGLNLVGPAGELRIAGIWGEKGSVAVFARGIDAAWWRDLLPLVPFNWSIANLYVKANWDHGPVSADTAGQLVVNFPDRAPITVNIAANSNGKVVVLERLQAAEEQTELADFSGALPVQLFAGARAHAVIDRKAKVQLDGKLNKDAPEWTELAKRLGVVLIKPNVLVSLAGTLDEPKGSLQFSADELQLDARYGSKKWPKLEKLQAVLSATGEKIDLVSGGLTIAGQSIELSGSLPVHEKTWSELKSEPLTLLRNSATLALHIPEADLSELAPMISPVLQPQGHVEADISLSGTGPWKGHLRFHDIATKPISSVGRLRDIHGDIEFAGRKITFNDFQLSFGERPIKIGGTVEVPPEGAPRIELTATGEDLPFVRQAGLLVRGNVRLSLSSAARKSLRPIIRGEIELTDGLFVSDVRALIPRGGSGPELRPPYFAVEAEPFRGWRLDVDVHGDKFLRARTTVFTGTTSMKFHLLGTLGEPRALGELRLNDGQVMFPFAQFSLNDATVRLTESDPYDPILGFFGKSRRYGYDLTMDITGNASAPVIAFSSNPSLSSEQVLLMVMAGDVPKDEISYSTTQKISRLGTFFGQSLLGSLGGGAGQDRLTITSGQEVSITGRETYDVEYALDNRWSLVGEYDQFDDYNAGVKWKILTKPKHAADEKK